jgi:hypothetical protein
MPGLPWEAIPLTTRWDELRRLDPHDPEICKTAPNDKITRTVCKSSKKAWMDKVKSSGRNSNPTKFLKWLGKQASQPPNLPITFGGKTFTKRRSMANKFNKQFSSVKAHRQNLETRRVQPIHGSNQFGFN